MSFQDLRSNKASFLLYLREIFLLFYGRNTIRKEEKSMKNFDIMNVLYNAFDLFVMIVLYIVLFTLIFMFSYMVIGAVLALVLALVGALYESNYLYILIMKHFT